MTGKASVFVRVVVIDVVVVVAYVLYTIVLQETVNGLIHIDHIDYSAYCS